MEPGAETDDLLEMEPEGVTVEPEGATVEPEGATAKLADCDAAALMEAGDPSDTELTSTAN